MKDDTTRFTRYAIVIDPSLIVRTIIRICLGREGIEVAEYANPLEALRAMAHPEGARVPDLVFVETDFPASPINGLAMVKLLRSKPALQQTPIIIVSRRDRVYDRLLGRLAGANLYLVKPIMRQDLQAVVRQFVT
jgi:two-component system, chemotaxis family, sensor histidine kinase and response regulator WspE